MSIRTREYEMSVWKETLAEEGQRVEEKKFVIIGSNTMNYLGRAMRPKFITKLNGTHTLTFEMPDKFFDSEKGDYIHNEFVDVLFSERKLKLYYKEKWYEFYVKNVSEAKHYKSFMRTYTCTDAFIDELARNGYGITFDEELYNNVDEVGVFSTEILDDSVWEYDSHLNWGDFTEYIEEKLFKIPLSLFDGELVAHKVNFNLDNSYEILNIYTNETRLAEMGDDLAREKGEFWDSYEGTNGLLSNNTIINSEDNDYIYIPYSQLGFCYVSSDEESQNGLSEAFVATEYPAQYDNNGYAIAPASIDPNSLIQFLFIPKNEKIEVDEAGLIVNKNYTYVMTVKEWNEQLNSKWFYKFEDYRENGFKKKVLVDTWNSHDYIYGNKAAYYDSYLNEIEGSEALTIEGKKINISDRTEINISEDIDQYVKVYNNKAIEYSDLYTSEDWTFDPIKDSNYRVCSKIETRQIVPQLARNLLQNSVNINSTTGWEIMESYLTSAKALAAQIQFCCTETSRNVQIPDGSYSIDVKEVSESYLVFTPASTIDFSEKNAAVNFGIIGQEKKIEKGKVYALGINMRSLTDYTKEKIGYDRSIEENLYNNVFLRIGTGQLIKDGDYSFIDNEYIDIPIDKFLLNSQYKGYILLRSDRAFDNPYFAIYSKVPYELVKIELFEAYTKGKDQFIDGIFRYSGRDLFSSYTTLSANNYKYSTPYSENDLRKLIIFEDQPMSGDTYEQTKYFIQKLQLTDGTSYDTFGTRSYLDANVETNSTTLPLSAGQYTEDDFTIITNYIDLNDCEFYNSAATAESFDCKCGSDAYDKICLYQKYGYCPYRFQTEKHCRRIRTLKGEKSNRFNLTQELGKVFKVYPMYWISHKENGQVMTQSEAAAMGTREITQGREDWMDKRLFYITENGKENQLGFRYEKNLSNISRTVTSDKIVSKLYVLDVDSQISPNGLSSIKTAEDNPSKDNFIIDFSYYIAQGLLDGNKVIADLYGVNENDLGYLKTLGYFNTEYDKISNQIINLSAASFTELRANLEVNLTGIESAQKRLRQLEKIMSGYTTKNGDSYIENSTFKSYQTEYIEQNAIYVQLIEDTFFTNGVCIYGSIQPADFFNDDKECQSIEQVKKKWVDTHDYNFGILGQFNKEYNQLKEWTKEQASYLYRINELSLNFYRKYEPFLKEGTWSDGNYISDNAYYYGAIDVAKEGAIPKVNYSITPIDIEPLEEEGDYNFEIADITYVEDIGMFGVNPKTGLPNRLKVLISGLEENPENPKDNKIEVQNFTTQFEDLFQQVSASVQSLTFNENIYKRSSNFTSLQAIETDSLQGALNTNELTLLQTSENNIELDASGQSGSDINNHNNKYKLNGQGLFFSNDGGQSWKTSISPNGMSADLIKAGTLDASKIKIVDGKYIYFNWDKSGITAYRDPKTTSDANSFQDYARFNKYGLSLVEKGQIKLRAGYQFNGDNGKADEEGEISGTVPIGFYLYNSSGKPIFSTETGITAKETARINLTGEMKVIDSTQISTFNGYRYGGVRYIRQQVHCYLLGSDEDLISSIDPAIAGTTATYTISADSSVTESECAAAIAYYYPNITQIEITKGEDTTVYLNPSVTENGTEMWGRLVHDSQNRYCQFTYYTVNYNNQPSQNFIIIPNSYFKAVGTLGIYNNIYLLTETSGQDISEIQLSATSVTGISSRETTGEYKYHAQLVVTPCYLLDNSYYTELVDDDILTSDGTVALYLNNREDLNESSQNKKNSRLFVCCSFSNNKAQNILSVLKDGSLYMGGQIVNTNGSSISNDSLMPDKVKVTDAYLSIEQDRLKMSFEKIVDTRTGQSIANYVMNELNDTAIQIESSIVSRIHDHYIDKANVGWTNGAILDGIDLSEATLIIEYNNQQYQKTIYDLLGALNITWGGAYTRLSSI